MVLTTSYTKTVISFCMLASKIQEAKRTGHDFLQVFHRMLYLRSQPNVPVDLPHLEVGSKTYWEKKTRFMDVGKLGFYLDADPPHKFLLPFLKVLGLEKNQRFAQKCWSYINDAMRLRECCIDYRGEIVAVAAIYLTSIHEQIYLYEGGDSNNNNTNETTTTTTI